MINVNCVQYKYRPLLLESINLKQFSTVFGCHSRNNNFYLFNNNNNNNNNFIKVSVRSSLHIRKLNTFTGIWVPEEFHSHTRHIGTLVRLRSKPNNLRVNWEQQFVSNSQVSYRTSHKKLKKIQKRKSSDCFILQESFEGKDHLF